MLLVADQPQLQLPLQLAAVVILTLGLGLGQVAGKAGRMITAIGLILLLAVIFADEPAWTRFSPLTLVWFLVDPAFGVELAGRTAETQPA